MAADKTGAAWGEHNATQQSIQRPLIVLVPVVSANCTSIAQRGLGQNFSSFQSEPFKGIGVLGFNNVLAPGEAMNASDRFLRFAAACEAMAKFTRSPENVTVWHQLAERWLRIADLIEHQNTLLVDVGRMKRPQKRRHGWAH
jgi:hypothetical protein